MKPLDIAGKRFGKLVAVDYFTKEGRRYWNCNCDCGGKTVAIVSALNSGSKSSCGCKRREPASLINQRFGKLVVTKIAEHYKLGRPRWECICDCGNTHTAESRHLTKGVVDNCGCLTFERRSKKARKDFGESMRNKILWSYKGNATRRGYTFELSDERAFELFKGNCHFCGTEPDTVGKHKKCYGEYVYNGIDRLNNDLGYIEGNVVSCCKTCNYLKSDYSDEEFVSIIRKIATHMNL